MAENSKIEWLDGGHTASPWHGCSEVHAGCDNCYARTMAKRNPGTLGVWGKDGTRVMSASFAKNCRRWNKSAQERGVIETVFPSICDPFEDWQGDIFDSQSNRLWIERSGEGGYVREIPTCSFRGMRPVTMDDLRRDLFALIDECQSLRFLLLTKRPENVRRMWPQWGFPNAGVPGTLGRYRRLENVWLLTSISNQETADAMIPHLLQCRDLAPVLGLSMEPLLGPVELSDVTKRSDAVSQLGKKAMSGIDWVILGGESGNGARPCGIGWIRSVRDQCRAAGVPCFVKQLGSNVLSEYGKVIPLVDKKGGDWNEWGVDLRVRQYPQSEAVPA